jgi:hypothetical protein
MLTIADPISGSLGKNGPHEHKRPAVIVATFGVCFLLAVPFTASWAGLAVGAAAAAGGALLGAAADGIKPIIRGVAVDDNLTMPLAAAVGIAGLFWLFGVDTGFDPFGFGRPPLAGRVLDRGLGRPIVAHTRSVGPIAHVVAPSARARVAPSAVFGR